MQKTEICLLHGHPSGSVGVSWVPWLPLIGCDKVTRTNKKKKRNFLAYRKRKTGEWLLGAADSVAQDQVLPQLAECRGESAVHGQVIPIWPRGTFAAPQKRGVFSCARTGRKAEL
jgi:hypothetical protein